MNNGRNRIKGTLNSYGVFPCPGTELIKCGSASGTGVMHEWNGTDWVASTYGTVTFTITFYDGGSARKGGALKPDYFGIQVDPVPSSAIKESTPIQLKGGNVTAS